MSPTKPAAGGPSARTRVVLSALVGLLVGAGTAFGPASVAAALLGWIAAAGVFTIWTWVEIWPQDPQATAAHARREDPSRSLADLACLTGALASLVAVGVLLIGAGSDNGTVKLLEIGLAIAAVVSAWALIHTVFTLRYARAYFSQGPDSIDFNQDEPPRYSDFAYVALTVGMSFQVSDTDLRASALRRLAVRHMLLSYAMGAVIVAVTINLVAGMTR